MCFNMRFAARLVAALAIVAMPAAAFAQTQRPGSTQPNPAAEHLAASRAALNKVLNAPAPSGEAFKKLSELKTEYIALERAASTASPAWSTHYQTINRLLTDLIGAPTTAAETGAVGTSGQTGAQLDAALAANLQEFRTHLVAFAGAMAAVAPPAAGATPAAAAPTAPPPPSAATPPPADAPVTPPPTPPPAAAPVTPPPSTPPPVAAPPAPAADSDAVARLDQLTGILEGLLKANVDSSGTISVDRVMIETIKSQLEQIKQSLKKP
jgi:hypothetical protein